MKLAKRLGRSLLLALVGLVIGVQLYAWNARALVGNEMPMPFGWGLSVVLSGSMEPTLSVNDLVVVRSGDAYAVGDIVVYQDGSALVIHRLIELEDGQAVTRGDANNTADPPISVAAIKGKFAARIPVIGAAVRFLKTPVGFLLVLAAAIVLFELPYLQQRKKAEEDLEKIKEEIRKLKDE